MKIEHEPVAPVIDKLGTCASQRFGQQGQGIGLNTQRRWVELIKLKVGKSRAGHRRQNQTLAPALPWVRCELEELSAAPRRQNHSPTIKTYRHPVPLGQTAANRTVIVSKELDRVRIFVNNDVRGQKRRLGQRAHEFHSRSIALRMDDSGKSVGSLAGEGKLTLFGEIKPGS